MCTVTLVYKEQNDFVLTSNRDEAPERNNIAPQIYQENNSKLLYPKDGFAGGTWLGVSNKKRLVCLLNGGFIKHKRQDTYRLSRGVVVKDFLSCISFKTAVNNYNLNNIEPFTIICAEWIDTLCFFELVWDGSHKHLKPLSLQPQIWSSSTLYTETMVQERKNWFETYKQENILNKSTLLHFHKHAGKGNSHYGVIMDRGFVKTTSITQIEKCGDMLIMNYKDLQKEEEKTVNFNLIHE